ncbi:MAG: SDR family oxidoreductase [Hyphomicrobiales bacterium]|nr:SDR family oxidoreductase [Hyphomicrobiales bacterium]
MPELLAGRTAIITGAASRRGIGLATARLFAEHGARVAIIDLSEEACETAANSLPGDGHLGYACDVTDRTRFEDAGRRIAEHFGRLDVLVHNAGIVDAAKIAEVTPEVYRRVMETNVEGTMNALQTVIPHMRRQGSGSIVAMSSVAAERGGGILGGPHYAASKGAIISLVKAVARELAPEGIRANVICPSFIDTDFVEGLMTPERLQMVLAGIPMGRAGTAEDVAGPCLFLASDLAAYVTGAVIDVNGGSHIH